MRVIQGSAAAKSTILQRSPLGFQEIPAGIRRKIEEVFAAALTPEQAVGRIIEEVRARGDAALFHLTSKLDKVKLKSLAVTREEITRAYSQVEPELISALNLAAQRIRSFHLAHRRHSWLDLSEGGLGQLILPLERVGIYVPGGTASYPSTVLMAAIPAKVAGVKEVVITTPPRGGKDIPPVILVAADIAGVDSIFKVGGAQAIAALAFGTESIPRVDKICGPGNLFVVLAKKLVYGTVDIDGLYGPTETVVVADDSADPSLCAADLLAQAEHDPLASAILITPSPHLAERVRSEVKRQLSRLERKDIAAASLKSNGGIILVADMEEAIELVNYYAPEHLCLVVRDAWSYLGRIKKAGGIFLGESSPEALGDYIAGPSHVMPTGGTARFSSALRVDDFLKATSIVALDREALKRLGAAAITIARAEGLQGHARSVEMRLDKEAGE
jgi:histidinol dehydrogenase